MNASSKIAKHFTPIDSWMKDYWLVEFSDGTAQLFDNEDEALDLFDYLEEQEEH